MFEDQSSVDEKIYSMEVGEKEECWEEERERENSVRLPSAINPDARRPTPDARRPTPDAQPLGEFETIMPASCSKR